MSSSPARARRAAGRTRRAFDIVVFFSPLPGAGTGATVSRRRVRDADADRRDAGADACDGQRPREHATLYHRIDDGDRSRQVTARDRTVIGVVLSLIAVVAVWLLVIQPKRDQASKLGNEIATAQSQLDQARQQVAAGLAAKSEFAKDYTTLARLGEAVPADDNVPSLIIQLQHAASRDGRRLPRASAEPRPLDRHRLPRPGVRAQSVDGDAAARRGRRPGRLPDRAVHVHLPGQLLPPLELLQQAPAVRRRHEQGAVGQRPADDAERDQPRRLSRASRRSPPRSRRPRIWCPRARVC